MTIPPNVLYADSFAAIERKARSQNKGLWGAADEPSPTSTPAAACKSPKIKGNINAKGDHIYHIPGGKSYDQTKAEAMFCTEKEAEAAGFRKAAQ
jgi:micrococcal nuclease